LKPINIKRLQVWPFMQVNFLSKPRDVKVLVVSRSLELNNFFFWGVIRIFLTDFSNYVEDVDMLWFFL
jgi:hypothetical protein